MRFSYPPEMKELRKIFEPYEDGCFLAKDAPKEAVDAYNKYYELFDMQYKNNIEWICQAEFNYHDGDEPNE